MIQKWMGYRNPREATKHYRDDLWKQLPVKYVGAVKFIGTMGKQ